MLDKFSEAIRGNLTKMERLKLVALVTIEVLYIILNCNSYCFKSSHLTYTLPIGPCQRDY